MRSRRRGDRSPRRQERGAGFPWEGGNTPLTPSVPSRKAVGTLPGRGVFTFGLAGPQQPTHLLRSRAARSTSPGDPERCRGDDRTYGPSLARDGISRRPERRTSANRHPRPPPGTAHRAQPAPWSGGSRRATSDRGRSRCPGTARTLYRQTGSGECRRASSLFLVPVLRAVRRVDGLAGLLHRRGSRLGVLAILLLVAVLFGQEAVEQDDKHRLLT